MFRHTHPPDRVVSVVSTCSLTLEVVRDVVYLPVSTLFVVDITLTPLDRPAFELPSSQTRAEFGRTRGVVASARRLDPPPRPRDAVPDREDLGSRI